MSVPRGVALDAAAIQWAKLLVDPCNSNLVHGCYPTGVGGTILMRVENDQIIANGATEVATFGGWVPGYGLACMNSTPQTSDTLGSLVTPTILLGPADAYLKTNANSVRCVAACMQISYPGSELNRAGVVAIGVGPADQVSTQLPTAAGGNNLNGSPQLYRTISQHVQRMPQDIVECRWFPGEADQTPYDPQYPTLYAQNFAGRNAILFSASGFPVSTGIRVRMVAVYEISLVGATGSVQAVAAPVSNNLPNQVLKFLADKDPQWYLGAAMKAGKTLGSIISYASQGAKAAGYAVNGLALLAA